MLNHGLCMNIVMEILSAFMHFVTHQSPYKSSRITTYDVIEGIAFSTLKKPSNIHQNKPTFT
jgi:hypothetical protein